MHRFLTVNVVIIVVLLVLSGCASLDRVTVTRFEPIKTGNNQAYFKYTSFADAMYPLKSNGAEAIRIGWLEEWLSDNGYSEVNYEILSRKPVLRKKGLIGDIYDIYYDVRVQRPNKAN